MYTRDVTNSPERLIKNGRPVFGTFSGNLKRLDIRGVEAPFGEIPFPHFISNFRIKSTLTFNFSIGEYIGTIDFFDMKIFGYAEVLLWSRETKRKLAYRSFMGPRRRFIPHNMESGFCISFNKNRYIRISWDQKRDRVSVLFNLKGDGVRPSVRGAIRSMISSPCTASVCSVIPAPTKHRCSATYTRNLLLHGSISLGTTKTSERRPGQDTDGYGILSINRTYYNLISKMNVVSATGKIGEDEFSFQIFSSQEDAVETENFNANQIVVNGEVTPLPPVQITKYEKTKNSPRQWIIQDFNNMVDLTFTPKVGHFRNTSFFVIKFQTNNLFGLFEGVIKTKDGKDIVLHEFEGFAKDQMMRL